jgi:hypothetical protein
MQIMMQSNDLKVNYKLPKHLQKTGFMQIPNKAGGSCSMCLHYKLVNPGIHTSQFLPSSLQSPLHKYEIELARGIQSNNMALKDRFKMVSELSPVTTDITIYA